MASSSSSSSASVTVISKCMVFPDRKSTLGDLKLSVSDLPMLSCHYIQKGCLFPRPPPSVPSEAIVGLLKRGLSQALALFPPLAGRLVTDPDGHVHISCDDAGAHFLHAAADVAVSDVLGPVHVPECIKGFFTLDRTVSYHGHFEPILAVQVTELKGGIFIGCTANHAVTDGTSFWNFFNTFAEVCRAGCRRVSQPPDFSRDSVLISAAVLRVPEGGPKVTFDENAPLAERIFSFSREAILELKASVNGDHHRRERRLESNAVELMGKHLHDPHVTANGKATSILDNLNFFRAGVSKRSAGADGARGSNAAVEISSFQSLCALLWKCVTRARRLPASKTITFRMAVNCRCRLEPALSPHYFGNAIQSIPTTALAGEVVAQDLRWCAEQLHKNVSAYDDAKVRRVVEDWERDPRCFPLGNPDGGSITMGSSPRFPMYDNDFGWGRPMAVRSGRANKFDGKFSAFPGRAGGGSVDIEVVLAPETMAEIETDPELMQYVSE